MNSGCVITANDMVFNKNRLYYFKKEIDLPIPISGKISVTADARYKLWVNGEVVSFGPYKGTNEESRYDTIDITEFIKDGKNTFLAEVLQLSHPLDRSGHRYLSSVLRTGNLGFALWGEIKCESGSVSIVTNKEWDCAFDNALDFIVPDYAYYGGLNEYRHTTKALEWQKAKEVWNILSDNLYGVPYGENRVCYAYGHSMPVQTYNIIPLLNRDKNGCYDAGKLVTGFIRLKARGKGSIRLTYAESYVFEENGKELKRDRCDTNGVIKGDYDIIEVDGQIEYETFWFRTFRFIKLEAEGVVVDQLQYAQTGYPLKICDDYNFGAKTDNALWDISINTLKCCMHETYEDCPYYEQLQYAMDTYLQIIYTLQLTDDCRLAKNAIHNFALSTYAGNISQARYPSITPQYIQGFSLFVVWMLDVIEKKCGEHTFIKENLPIVDNILNTFDKFKRKDGLLKQSNYWNFIDWADAWEETRGVPVANIDESLTVYNMMLVSAFDTAARLNRIFARNCVADEYEEKSIELKKAINSLCFNKEIGLYGDTEKQRSFSCHAQAWAVLSGVADLNSYNSLMKKAHSLDVQGSFAYAYFIFRAYEKAGLYEYTEDMLDKYRELVYLNCTTIPEIPGETTRSECHAWGAVVIYEFTAVVLGVKEEREGIIDIVPYMRGRNSACGSVNTKYGRVYVDIKVNDSVTEVYVKSDNDVEICIHKPNGDVVNGVKQIKCVLSD